MDLKPYYDAAMTADTEVKRIAQEIDAHFTAGETDQALALRPALDEARLKATQANELYLSMRDASEDSKVPHLFVPANPDAPKNVPGSKAMTRDAFEALSAHERMSFVSSGGQVEEKE